MKAFGISASLLLALGTAFVAVAHADTLDDARSPMREGRQDDAVKPFDRPLRTSASDFPPRFLKGVSLAEAGRSREAIAIFSDLAKDFPMLPELHNIFAALLTASGDVEKAQSHLLEAIRTHPS